MSPQKMTDDRRRALADDYRSRRWLTTCPAADAEEYRALRDAGEPLTAEALYAMREEGLRSAAKPTRRKVRRCVECRVAITGDESYTEGCSACSERRKKRRQRGEEVDEV